MLFYDNLKYFKTNTALISDNTSFSYEKLIEDAKKLSVKIKNQSLIFLLVDNDYESICSIISTEYSNSVGMLLNSNINEKILINLINIYSPDYIFLNKLKNLNLNFLEDQLSFYNYILVKNNKSSKKEINKELFLLQSTSGSTGSPKNVRISYENLISNTRSIINDLKINEKDIAITTLPLSYVYGLSIINTHLQVGAKIVLNKNSIFENKFWKKLISTKSNNFGGVPFTYEILLKIGLKEEYFQFIKYSTLAGGHLQNNLKSNLLDFYEEQNISLITMYGAAEATARMSFLPSEYARRKNGSIGRAISHGNFTLESEKNEIINQPNCKGELVYTGKNVCMGYSNSSTDLKKKNENNYVLRTGDIGYFDKDGFFYIVGKKNRYVKIVGNRVSLDEIEKIIYDFGYKNICVQQSKDKINIYVNENSVEGKIRSYISSYLNLNINLIKVKFIRSFPKTMNNKIDYNNEIFKYEN